MAANASAPPEGDLTAVHVKKCFPGIGTLFNTKYFKKTVLPLLIAERNTILRHNLTHSIDCNTYDNIFITSDIHADYRKLIQTLVDNDLITLPAGFTRDYLFGTFNIYDPVLITQTRWNKSRTCLIILGDIVDGKRKPHMQVEDPLGQFEILIHMFLFNLRRRALEKNSLVAFTLGNHDFHSIIAPLDHRQNDISGNALGWFDRYVHDTAKSLYYDNQYIRRFALLPFYEVYPLFFVSIKCPQKEDREEMVGIHAGFHNYTNENLLGLIRAIQKMKVDVLGVGESLNSLQKSFLDIFANNGVVDGALWSRMYERENVCETLRPLAPKLFVVGHCPTIYDERNQKKRHSMTKYETPGYENCMGHGNYETPEEARGKRGCVVLSCNNKLAHVDVGMSTSFYNAGDWAIFNRTSDKEMLHLSHDPALSIEDRYYNVIARVSRESNIEMFREVKPVCSNKFCSIMGGRRSFKRFRSRHRKFTRRQPRK